MGEGYPDRFYGETPETMSVVFPLLLDAVGEVSPDEPGLAAADLAMEAAIRGHGAARCAVDIALHDLVGKVTGRPVHEIRGLSAVIPPTDFTIGIDEPDVVAQRAARAADFPALKIKCGGPEDLATLEAVRAVFDGPIRVDANTGWVPDEAVRLLPELERLGVELIEQPFPAGRLDQLRWLQERSSLPLVADESCVLPEDLDRPRRGRRRRQRQARQVRRDRSGQADARTCPDARLQDLPRLHGGDIGRDRRIGGRRLAGRLGRSRRLPAAGRRPIRGPRPRRRASLDPAAATGSRSDAPRFLNRFTHGQHRRSKERPFVWISWWMKSWTSPLPGRPRGSYHWRPPLAEDPGGGPTGAQKPTSERWTAPSGQSGHGSCSPKTWRVPSPRAPDQERRSAIDGPT